MNVIRRVTICSFCFMVRGILPLALLTLLTVHPYSTKTCFAEKPKKQLKRFRYSQPHMGVKFNIILYALDESVANKAAKAAFLQVKMLNRSMSDYHPNSELSKLSKSSPTDKPVAVSHHLWKVLRQSQKLSKKTDGAFDVTIGPYSKLWREARKNKKIPDVKKLAEAAKSVGYKNLVLLQNKQTVKLLQPKMLLDLGGIAKGYAADEAMRVLRKHGIQQALVDASGDMVLGKAPPDKKGWVIAVASERKDSAKHYLQLSNCAVATSGDLYQHLVIEQKRYSHIINPHTGIGLTNRTSVTVIAPDGISADSLASAISVLGPTKGVKLAEQLCDVETYILQATQKLPKEYQSSGFKKHLLDLEDQ